MMRAWSRSPNARSSASGKGLSDLRKKPKTRHSAFAKIFDTSNRFAGQRQDSYATAAGHFFARAASRDAVRLRHAV